MKILSFDFAPGLQLCPLPDLLASTQDPGFLRFSGPGLPRKLEVEASYLPELQKSFEAQKSEFPQPYKAWTSKENVEIP